MRLNIGFSGFSNDKLADRADTIFHALTGNASFPSPTPTLVQLAAATKALRDAVALPLGPGRAFAVATARTALIALLQALGLDLDTTPGATPGTLATTGFILPKQPTRATTPPAAPGDLRLSHGSLPGEVIGKCRTPAGARSFEGEWTLDPNVGPWNDGGAFPSTLRIIFTGLPRGKDVWIRLRAVGTLGAGPWSDPATIMVT